VEVNRKAPAAIVQDITDKLPTLFTFTPIHFRDTTRFSSRSSAAKSGDRFRASAFRATREVDRPEGARHCREHRDAGHDHPAVPRAGGEDVRRQPATRPESAADCDRRRTFCCGDGDAEPIVGLHALAWRAEERWVAASSYRTHRTRMEAAEAESNVSVAPSLKSTIQVRAELPGTADEDRNLSLEPLEKAD